MILFYYSGPLSRALFSEACWPIQTGRMRCYGAAPPPVWPGLAAPSFPGPVGHLLSGPAKLLEGSSTNKQCGPESCRWNYWMIVGLNAGDRREIALVRAQEKSKFIFVFPALSTMNTVCSSQTVAACQLLNVPPQLWSTRCRSTASRPSSKKPALGRNSRRSWSWRWKTRPSK